MKIKDYTYRIFGLLVILMVMTGCRQDCDEPGGNNDPSERGEYTTLSVEFPEMQSGVGSRAFGDAPDLAALKLHLIVFDNRGSFIKYLSQDGGEITNVRVGSGDDAGKVFYDAKLPYSTAPRVVHLIASTYDINYNPGREEVSLPALELQGDKDAYWNRVELPNGIGSYDEENAEVSPGDEVDRLSGVKLVRNFAKVSVNGASVGAAYKGFVLVNRPRSGTIVPYIGVVAAGESHFADYTSVVGSDNAYETLIARFTGWESTDNALTYTSAGDFSDADFNTDAEYLYERTYNVAGSPSFVIIKGSYGGRDYYYHIDLVKLDAASGQSTGYHLLRNFEYTVTIENIKGEGYSTVAAAIAGEASNNISYSASTRDLYAISNTDGHKIEVDFTQKVYVGESGVLDGSLKFRYTINNAVQTTDLEALVTENDNNVLVDAAGNAIAEGSKLAISAQPDADGWFTVDYKVVAMQYGSAKFRVYRNGGLGREIEIISRSPWVFNTDGVSAGQSGMVFSPTLTSVYDLYAGESMPYAHTTSGYGSGFGHGNSAPLLNIYIKVPKTMPKSTFPLVFKFESRNQVIFPNPAGVLTTHVEDSGFADGSKDKRIVFHYTLEYKDFSAQVGADGKQGDVIIVASFRFNVPSSTGGRTDVVRVSNPYFKAAEVSYTRL